jgi:hypothetical protein
MAVTSATFRAAFPAFGGPNTQTYPDLEIEYWLGLSLKLMNVPRWGNLLDDGQMLFVAHNLSLEFNAKKATAKGQNPGEVKGMITSASVDKVSFSRDSSFMDPKNGHWGLSIYGLRYIRLVKMIGAGPVYVGAPSADELNQSGSAWAGVTQPPY